MSLGFYLQPWQTVDYVESPSIGRFEGAAFDPPAWKPRIPTAAFLRARADDNFWAARRVAAFSNEMIRALVNTGRYTAPDAAGHLTEVLVQRRDKIAAAYLTPINPVVNLTLGADGLSFENAAVAAGVAQAPTGGYQVAVVSLRQHHRRHDGDRRRPRWSRARRPRPRGPAGRRGHLSEGAGRAPSNRRTRRGPRQSTPISAGRRPAGRWWGSRDNRTGPP